MRTQDLPAKTARDLYAFDPDHVTQPDGTMPMRPLVFWSLVALRVYLVALLGLVAYRFVAYAHLMH